jgi:hypothetical protein
MKKTISIVVLLIFFVVQAISAQEKKDSISIAGKLKNKFMAGVGVAPIYTYPTYDPRANGDITMGYSLYFKYKINKRFNLSAGISYESLQYQTPSNYTVFGSPVKYFYEYTLRGFPLKMDIVFGQKKLFACITPGIYLSKLIDYKFGNGSIFPFQKGKNLTLGSIAASIHYNLNKHFDLFLEPEKVIAFTPIKKNSMGEGINYLQYAKINIGFLYVF